MLEICCGFRSGNLGRSTGTDVIAYKQVVVFRTVGYVEDVYKVGEVGLMTNVTQILQTSVTPQLTWSI